MALDPSIILQGRAPDIMGALTRSNDAAQSQRNNLRQRDIEQLYKTEGAGMLAGNQNSLNALAGYDPGAAQGLVQNQLGMDQTRQSMAISAEEMQMKRAEIKRLTDERIATKADNLTKEKAAEESAMIERGIAALSTAETSEQWNAIAQRLGLPPNLINQFDNRKSVIAEHLGVKDSLDAFSATPEPQSPEGKLALDQRNGLVPVTPPKADFADVSDLRKEWIGMPAIKAFQTQSDALGRIIASAEKPSAAGDMAMIYGYMKMLDPGSVVRETEFAAAAQSGSLGEQIQGAVTKLLNGQRLTEDQRADFLARATGIYKNAEAEYDTIRGQYTGIATRNNFPVDDALPDYRYSGSRTVAPADGSNPPPAAGTMEASAPVRLEDAGPTQADWDKAYEQLPSGTTFTGPDGVKRTKP